MDLEHKPQINVTPEIESASEELWKKALLNIKEELSEQSFKTWFSSLDKVIFNDNVLTVKVPDKFYGDWLREHYQDIIQSSFFALTGSRPEIDYSVSNKPIKEHKRIPKPVSKSPAKPVKQTLLNSRYVLDDFVIGPGNRFAHAATLAVSESPAKTYNPLFIYGPVGLGKTHLLQGAALHIMKKFPDKKVLYISSENFTNQLINAIQNRSTHSFRATYRSVDVLLIDDVHFIAGKESTQEEFFHTFNALYDAHKQIIVTSDRPPKEIPSLEERLVSRFEWGLITDIQPPDLETRVAILRKKVEKENVAVPDDVTFFIASKIKSNIRELEGALVRVLAFGKLTNTPIDVEAAKKILKDALREEENKITIESIQKKVADFFNIKVSDMRMKRRTKTIAFPRQIAMFLIRSMTDHSLPEIGEYFGGRDHATVIHACNKITKEIENKAETKKVIEELKGSLKND